MYTVAALIDVHERTHRSLRKLLDHCAGFSDELLNRELESFSYPSVRLQLHHVITSERYWFGVLRGQMLLDGDAAEYLTIEALEALRTEVASETTAYLRQASDEAVSAACSVTAWRARRVEVVPAHVLFRTQTHVYQHQGEIASMSRHLGRPFPQGLDFPLT